MCTLHKRRGLRGKKHHIRDFCGTASSTLWRSGRSCQWRFMMGLTIERHEKSTLIKLGKHTMEKTKKNTSSGSRQPSDHDDVWCLMIVQVAGRIYWPRDMSWHCDITVSIPGLFGCLCLKRIQAWYRDVTHGGLSHKECPLANIAMGNMKITHINGYGQWPICNF